MITREQYIQALDIVEAYHSQLSKDYSDIHKTKIDTVCKTKPISIRFSKILKTIKEVYNIDYFEDITTEQVLSIRGAAKKAISEFEDIKANLKHELPRKV